MKKDQTRSWLTKQVDRFRATDENQRLSKAAVISGYSNAEPPKDKEQAKEVKAKLQTKMSELVKLVRFAMIDFLRHLLTRSEEIPALTVVEKHGEDCYKAKIAVGLDQPSTPWPADHGLAAELQDLADMYAAIAEQEGAGFNQDHERIAAEKAYDKLVDEVEDILAARRLGAVEAAIAYETARATARTARTAQMAAGVSQVSDEFAAKVVGGLRAGDEKALLAAMGLALANSLGLDVASLMSNPGAAIAQAKSALLQGGANMAANAAAGTTGAQPVGAPETEENAAS